MKLRRLAVANWRGLARADIAFDDGVTLITGRNEAGKSSLIEALRCLLRYPDDSGHRELRAVRPVHADAAPEVILEAELGATRMVFAKRFRKPGRTGETTLRLSSPGRNDTTLTGREAHDRALALLHEHVDTDLWEALQIEQGTGIAQAMLKDKRGLQEALDRAAGNDADPGTDDPALFARVEAEYGRYFTPTGRARDRLESLPRELGTLTAERDALRRRIDDMQDVVERHRGLLDQFEDARRRVPELHEAAAGAEAEWRRVQQLRAAWEQSGLEVRNLALTLDASRRQQQERRDRVAEIAELDERIVDRQAQARELETALDDGQARLSGLRAEHTALEESAEAAVVRQRHYQDLIERARVRRELERIDQVVARVSAVDRQREAMQATVDGFRIDETGLGALRRLHGAVVEAEATARAASPRVAIDALRELDLEIAGRARHLKAGERHVADVTAGLALTLPGLAEITIAATDEIESRAARAAQARRAFDAALHEVGCASLADAESRADARRDALAGVERLAAERAGWLGDDSLAGLLARRDELAARLPATPVDAGDEDTGDADLSAGLDAARADERRAREALQGLAVRLSSQSDGVAEQRVRQVALDEQIKADRERRDQLRHQLAAARGELPDRELDDRVEALQREGVAADAELDRLRGAYEAGNPEQAELLAANTKAARDRHGQELNRLQIAIGELDGQLLQARREGLYERLNAVEVDAQRLQQELARVERRAAAARRLFEVMREARDAAARRYVLPLKQKIDALGRLVFNPSFAVDIGDDLVIVSRSLDGVTVPFDSLSIGAQEQLGILARLAAAELVGQQGDVPLLMDDTLGYADQARLATMGAAIARVARDNQVIILTCMPGRFAYVGNAKTVAL